MRGPASPGDAGHVLLVAELGLGVVVGGAAVVEVAEVGALGGDWVGRGPVHPDPHPHCHSDSNSKKAEITLTRGVDAKCNYLREV